MSEPWFDGPTAGLIGAAGGVVGGLSGCYGGLAGWLAPKGRAKGLMLTLHVGFIVLGLLSLAVGVAALADGQPYHVWYVFVLPGALFTVLFSLLLPVIRQRYREAEQRKLVAEDLG